MLTGREAAAISSSGLGCTLLSNAYQFDHEGTNFRIHDTAGLNEGEAGRVPHRDAVFRLCKLLYELSDGVSLLVFVMRAPRIKDTGLELEDDMDGWCGRRDNWDAFRQYGVHFCAMAGITASRGKRKSNGSYTLQEEYAESATKLKTLVRKHHLLTPWKVERLNWFREIYRTDYETHCFKTTSRQVFVGTAQEEATKRLISECGMQPGDAEKLARDLDAIKVG
jgi:hypothetical protein